MTYSLDEFRETFKKAIEENKYGRFDNTIKIRSFIQKQSKDLDKRLIDDNKILDIALHLATQLIFWQDPSNEEPTPSEGLVIHYSVDDVNIDHHYTFHEVGQNIILRFATQKDVCLDFIEFPKNVAA